MSAEPSGPTPKLELKEPSLVPRQLAETVITTPSPAQGERATGPSRDFQPAAAPSPLLQFIGRFGWRAAGLLVLVLCAIAAWHFFTRPAGATDAANDNPSAASTASPVAVAKATREDLYNELTIPAEFRPYLEVELHAKVSGYVEQITADFGDEVKAGQLLAKLEIPELKNDLDRAAAAAKRAEADYHEAHLVYSRLQSVNHASPNLVAEQELDAAQAKDSTAEAAVAGANAEVGKLQTMLAYTRITAPFDGVVTHRYADPGALIQAGTASDTQARPLVRLSDNYHLRLDFPVSVAYIKYVRVGDHVDVRVESCGKTLSGVITRNARRVDEGTRTMVTEIEVPNPNLELVPGMYATVVLRVERHPHTLTVPTEAVSSGKKPTVYLVNEHQEIEERPVTLGMEAPGNYEILEGLKEGDLVMIGSRSQVKPGQKVEPKIPGAMTRK